MSNKLIFSKLLNIKTAGNQNMITSGNINGIISNNSNVNIKNSTVISPNTLTLDKQNDITVISSNLSGTILNNLNNNVINTSKYDTEHIISNVGVNSLYNFPAVNFEKDRNNTNLELNTTLFNCPPYLSKPVLLSGDTPVFGSFNDGILLDDVQILLRGNNTKTIVDISIIELNNSTVYGSDSIQVSPDIFFKKLPKNLNGHKLSIKCNNLPESICKISNLIGGSINFHFITNNKAKFVFQNCKNIKIYGLNAITFPVESAGIQFINCKNVNIQNIIFKNHTLLIDNNNTLLYFKDTNAVIKKCSIEGQANVYGIIASNSKIYLEDTSFKNCVKNSILYNFASIDTNNHIETLQDYISEITSGELDTGTNVDGLYRHFHPGYLPPPAPTPVGATVGFPRIVNGQVYCRNLSATPNDDRGILYTRSMENTLPSCFIPFDLYDDKKIESWRTQYKEKLDWLSGTVYKDLKYYIIPFNSAVENNSYSLFFGDADITFNDKNASVEQLTSLVEQYVSDIPFITNIKLNLQQNISCRVSEAPNNNGIISQIYSNETNVNNQTYIFSANLNLLSIKQFFVASSYIVSHPDDQRLRDFYNNFVLKNSYIAFMIDNTYVKIPFNYIVHRTNATYQNAANNIAKILSKYITATTNNLELYTYELNSIPIRFNKSITNIEVYYFGIPSDTNCCNIVGGGGKTDNFSTIKSFTYSSNDIFKLHTKSFSGTCNINCTLMLPMSKAYYQFYADTILCFYNNLLSNQINLADNSRLLQNTHINLFMNRIFRRVIDAHNSLINYKYISGVISSDFTGLYYQKDNDNKWWLLNQQEIRQSDYKDYYITATGDLYNSNNKIGTFTNGIATISNKSYTLYDRAKNNLLQLCNIMPSAVLDIADEYETPPYAYIQTDILNGKTYGNVPAEGYNFDFSRQSINSMVSGYFRLKGKGKKYIYTTQSTNRILTGQIDGFETNLNRLYNSLISLKTYISMPLYTYTINDTNYNIYPFDTQSVLSTTPYALNQNLLKSNILMATLNRITDAATSKHSQIITDNISNTKNDILFQNMYPQSFCQSISARYNLNAPLTANILDSYQMYWPLTGNEPLSSYRTCIPIIKDDYINNQTFKIGNSNISAYPFGWVGSNTDRTTWYPYLTNRTLKCKHYYNKLPMVYNINHINTSTATITYTGYIKIQANSTINKVFINSTSAAISDFKNITTFKNTLTKARNVLQIQYDNNKIAVFVIPSGSTINNNILNTNDENLFASKYQYFYSYTDSFTCNNFSAFKNAYQNIISYMSNKVNAIYNNVLSGCQNQASFMSYSLLYNNDTFIYGTQNNTSTTNIINFNELKGIPSYNEIFSVGDTIKYFTTEKRYNNDALYTSNYALSAIIPSLK